MPIYDKDPAPALPTRAFPATRTCSLPRLLDPATTAAASRGGGGGRILGADPPPHPTPLCAGSNFGLGKVSPAESPEPPTAGRRRRRAGACPGRSQGGAGFPGGRGALPRPRPRGRARSQVSLRHREVPIRYERGLALVPGPQWLSGALQIVSPVRSARPLRPVLPACSSRQQTRGPRTRALRSPGYCRGAPVRSCEMPGKKARKNAQPSPSRAPAGREPLGPAEILAGAGAGVEVSVRAGSASLRRAARSGQVCALVRASGAPPENSGVLPRSVEQRRT